MVPIYVSTPNTFSASVTLVMTVCIAFATSIVVGTVIAYWSDTNTPSKAYAEKLAGFFIWTMCLLLIRMISQDAALFDQWHIGNLRALVVLASIAVSATLFSGISSTRFALLLTNKIDHPRQRGYLWLGYSIAVLSGLLLLFAPTLAIDQIVILAARDTSIKFASLSILLIFPTFLYWAYSTWLILNSGYPRRALYHLGDLLVLTTVTLGSLLPSIVSSPLYSQMLSLLSAAGAFFFLWFFFFDNEMNPTKRALAANAANLAQTKKTLHNTTVLNKIGRILSHEAQADLALQAIVNTINEIIPCQDIVLVIFSDDKQSVATVVYADHNVMAAKSAHHTVGYWQYGLVGWVLEKRQTARWSDLQRNTVITTAGARALAADGIVALLASPLVFQDKLVGGIIVRRTAASPDFSDFEIATIESVCMQLAGPIAKQLASQETAAALARSETLRNVGAAISQDLALNVLFDTLSNEVSKTIAASELLLVLVDAQQKTGQRIYYDLAPNAQRTETLIDWAWLSKTLMGRAIQTKSTIVSSLETPDDHQTEDILDRWQASDIGSVIAVPLQTQGRVLGALKVTRRINHMSFDQADAAMLETIADLASVAIANSQLLERQRQARQQAELMFDVAQTATESTDLDGLINTILETCYAQIRSRWIVFHLVDDVTQTILNTIYLGPKTAKRPHHPATYHDLSATLSGYVLQTTTAAKASELTLTQFVSDYKPDYRRDLGIDAVMCAPLVHQGDLLGVIAMSNEIGAPAYTPDELALLVTIANQMANTLANFDALEKIRQSETQFRTLIENAPDAIVLLDIDNTPRILDVNPSAQTLFGLTRAEFLALDPNAIYPTSDNATTADARRLAVETTLRDGRHSFEHDLVKANGDVFTAEIRMVALPGQSCVIRSSIVDISERKRDEAVELQSQKLESLGVMAGGIAHDFNNLLLAMMGQAQIAERRLDAASPVHKNIKKIQTAAQRASELTRQMMAYAGRGQTTERTPIDVNQLIRENADLLRATIPQTIQLHQALREKLPVMFGEQGQIQQVIMNMMINASEAIGTEIGDIWVSTQTKTITNAALAAWQTVNPDFKAGDYVALTFRDNGSGMTPETFARIFDPFFTTKHTGHGLGLAAVLGIIRSHGGGIQVETAAGVGTTFDIVFPIDLRAKRVTGPLRPQTDLAALKGRTVLVIDDDEAVIETVIETLSSYDMHVHSAMSGTAGIEVFKTHKTAIELTIVDITMPGISGVDTMRKLRQLNPNARVILSSGYNRVGAEQVAEIEENVAFLQKPYRTEQLLALISDVLVA